MIAAGPIAAGVLAALWICAKLRIHGDRRPKYNHRPIVHDIFTQHGRTHR